MSNIVSEYIPFTVTDYTGSTTTLSSYNLSITPLVFTPQIATSISSGRKLVWDFGDNTTSNDFSPSHWYSNPGVYTVSLYVYDSFGQARYSTNPVNVSIKDYIQDTFTATTSATILTAVNGALTDPIVITQTIPARTAGYKTVIIEDKDKRLKLLLLNKVTESPPFIPPQGGKLNPLHTTKLHRR